MLAHNMTKNDHCCFCQPFIMCTICWGQVMESLRKPFAIILSFSPSRNVIPTFHLKNLQNLMWRLALSKTHSMTSYHIIYPDAVASFPPLKPFHLGIPDVDWLH